MNRCLIIGLDGLSLELLDSGRLATLSELRAAGAHGALDNQLPLCAPAHWASLLSGYGAERHGLLASTEPDPDDLGTRPIGANAMQANHLARQLADLGEDSLLLGIPGTHRCACPRTRCVSDAYPGQFEYGGAWSTLPNDTWHGLGDSQIDELLQLRIDPTDLGNEELQPLLPELADIDQDEDRRPASVAVAMARTLSLHNAATLLLEAEASTLTAVRYPLLADLGTEFFAHHWRLDASSADNTRYAEVINGACLLLDLLVARLLHLAGPDTLVLVTSSHGFQTRQGKVAPHTRSHFILHGPGLAPDAEIHGPHLLDIAPSLLCALGHPVELGSQGRPWLEAFEPSVDFTTREPLPSPQAESQVDKSGTTVDALMAQLANQGLNDPLEQRLRQSRHLATRQRLANLYLLHRKQGRMQQAIEAIATLIESDPNNLAWRLEWLSLLVELDQTHEAATLAEQLLPLFRQADEQANTLLDQALPAVPATIRTALLEGVVALGSAEPKSRRAAATRLVEAIPDMNSALGCVLCGALLARLGELRAAIAAHQRALGLDASSVAAHIGLRDGHQARGAHETALEHALRAIDLHRTEPTHHERLAEILELLGEHAEASAARATAAQLRQRRQPA